MDIDKIIQLIDKVDASGISSLTVEEGCLKINIEKSTGQTMVGGEPCTCLGTSAAGALQAAKDLPAAGTASLTGTGAVPGDLDITLSGQSLQQTTPSEDDGISITAPLVGVFYSAPGPEDEPFVKVGDNVSVGQVIGIIEAMKLMNEIESDVDGIVTEILVDNQQSVAYGQSLLKIK